MKHNQIRQVVFPILAALICGTAFVAQDVCADTIGTFTFNAVRYFIAVLALLVLIAVLHAVHKDRPQPTEAEKRAGRRQLWLGGFCCGTALAIASNFQQAGITAGTDAGKAGFLTALYVVLVPVFGLFFRRKVSLPVWIAVVLSVVSLYLLCIKGSFRLAAGDLLVLVCAVCFAVHILVIDRFSATCDGVKLSCVQFLFAALWSAVCIPVFAHVDAAALLFLQKGYQNTTLQDIIDATKLSKGAVYHHFRSKEELAQRVGDRLGDQMWEPLRHIRADPALTGLQKLQAVFAASFAGQRQQQIAQTLPHLCSNPQFLAMELTNIEAHLAPECIAPMIRQGMADGSIHTTDANALAEALFVLADIWLSPQTRPTTPTEQRARNVVFQQMTHALGLDLLTDAQAEQLVQLCTPVKD